MKQKRMIYVYEENLDFYDGLENKSVFLNDALQDARVNTRIKEVNQVVEAEIAQVPNEPILPPEEDPSNPDYSLDPRIRDTRRQVREMHERDAARRV